MFTGIVQNLGTLMAKKATPYGVQFKIKSSLSAASFRKGASIAVDGVCLTVEAYSGKVFTVSLVKETLKKSRLGGARLGEKFNLETPLTLETLLSGHFVSGHTDSTGKVLKIEPFQISVPEKYLKFMPEKGSVTINGVSLTIAKRLKNGIEIALIPETKKSTNLGAIQVGDSVNIEIDLLARYLFGMLTI
jgi:riboflavin synthase